MVEKKIKIIYLISSIYKDGGHYHSLKTLMTAAKEKADISVIPIGFNDLYHFQEFNHRNIFWNGLNTICVVFRLIKHLKRENPDIIHAYDYVSYLFAKVCGDLLNIKSVMTKCGGPSIEEKFPVPDSLFLFSKEDMDFYEKHPKYSKTNLYFMPNRVLPFETSDVLTKKIREKVGIDKKIVMRISRFSSFHLSSILQTIKLAKLLNETTDDEFRCVIVGTIQEENLYRQVLEEGGDFTTVFSEKDFTKNAKKCLGAADIVVGTGRGLMEAAQKKDILFVPSETSEYPIPFNEKYFQQLFDNNFSVRNNLKVDENEIVAFVKDVSENEEKNEKVRRFVKDVYEEFFDIEKVIENYLKKLGSITYIRFHKFLLSILFLMRETKNVYLYIYKKSK